MLVKFGGGIVDARGSLAGNVFSRNKSGAYARARVVPVNPNSSRQSAIRAIVADVTQRWLSVLTGSQRDAWEVFASNVPAKNKLGEVINLSGFNQFVKSNIAANNAALPDIAAGPVIFDLPGEDPDFDATIDAGTGKVSVVFDDARAWVDEDEAGMIIQCGIPVNASIKFFDGPYRHAGIILGDSVAAPTTPDATIDVPFEVADGQQVFVRGKIIRADGRLSDWFRVSTIVATA